MALTYPDITSAGVPLSMSQTCVAKLWVANLWDMRCA